MIYPKIAVLGAGTIGSSWAALFAATGRQVIVYDPSANAREQVLKMIENTAPALAQLGWENAGNSAAVSFTDDPVEAVRDADFIQESVPERLDIKFSLFASIEPHLKSGVIVGSSTSGLRLSQMQQGFNNPGRFLIAHPFNPPHLIPLVELMDNQFTDSDVLDQAKVFYESIGKVCIRLHREVAGHIANRLQAAIWRETIHLATSGVASVEDIDKAVTFGPGLRWAAKGPNTLFHLGGGEAGIRGFCEHLGGPFASWWQDLGTPDLTDTVIDQLEAGVLESIGDSSAAQLAAERDQLILSYLQAMEHRKEKH